MPTRRDVLSAGAGVAAVASLVGFPAAMGQQLAPNLGANRLVLLGTRGGPRIATG